MALLITGGAGYIGSVTNAVLREKGFDTIIFDNFSSGRAPPKGANVVKGDITNKSQIDDAIGKGDIDAVMHMAALAHVGDSMKRPGDYFMNNVSGTANLLGSMDDFGIKKIIFSSSCAVYGTPERMPVTEETPVRPESVYAETKAMAEKMLLWYEKQRGFECTVLRYFNVAGASHSTGEMSGRLVSNALGAALGGHMLDIYGNDYPTKDGTCIRDYVHVEDVAQAHVLSLNKTGTYNIGYGNGVSNMEMVRIVEDVTGKGIHLRISPRRSGDPAEIFADGTKARRELGWKPRHDIRSIVESAAEWMQEALK